MSTEKKSAKQSLRPGSNGLPTANAHWRAAGTRPLSLRFARCPAPGVRAGLGAGVPPCFVGDADGELEPLTPPETMGEFGIWVLTHPDLRRSAGIRLFVGEIGSLIAVRESELLGERR